MKKCYVFAAFLLLTVLLVGCATPAAVPVVDEAAHYNAQATAHKELQDGTTAPAAARAAEQATPSGIQPDKPAISATRFSMLNRLEAREIALQQAGVTADEVTCFEMELFYDDARQCWEYEVEFCVGNVEYDIVLNAENGALLKTETEQDND